MAESTVPVDRKLVRALRVWDRAAEVAGLSVLAGLLHRLPDPDTDA